jgi:hypothetical protein
VTTTTRDQGSATEALHALLNHPATSEEEKDAARRALTRIARREAKAAKARGGYWAPQRTYGSKYNQSSALTLTEIAKLMREDIKLARKIAKLPTKPGQIKVPDPIGDAPTEIKFGVTTQYYSGGGSINITVRNIPEEWGFEEETHPYPHRAPTRALDALSVALREIWEAYNYDGSDIQADLFDRRYYGGVRAQGGMSLGHPRYRP